MSGLRLLERARHQLRIRADFAFGLSDQAIISGCSFFLTLILANALDAKAFGRFSIAWAFLILLESVIFRGLFDDGLPAAAHRLPKSLWPQLRMNLYASSLGMSGLIGGCLVVAGFVASMMGQESGSLAIATGFAIPANRLQNMFRRFCYLDGKLPRLVIAAVIYLGILAGSIAVMIVAGMTSAAAAMMCIAVSAAAAGCIVFVKRRELAWPQRRIARWSIARLFRSGRWFVVTSLTYWIGSIGLIPLSGALIGLEASGSLRIILVAFAPLSQFNASMVSVKMPRTAAQLRSGGHAALVSAAERNAWLFGGVSMIYGILMVAVGVRPLMLLVHNHGYEIGVASMLLMALAMTLDGIWLGLALPLFAIGEPKRFMSSRLAGLILLCCALPGAAYGWGVIGLIGSMVLSSAASVCVLSFSISRSKRF